MLKGTRVPLAEMIPGIHLEYFIIMVLMIFQAACYTEQTELSQMR